MCRFCLRRCNQRETTTNTKQPTNRRRRNQTNQRHDSPADRPLDAPLGLRARPGKSHRFFVLKGHSQGEPRDGLGLRPETKWVKRMRTRPAPPASSSFDALIPQTTLRKALESLMWQRHSERRTERQRERERHPLWDFFRDSSRFPFDFIQ